MITTINMETKILADLASERPYRKFFLNLTKQLLFNV